MNCDWLDYGTESFREISTGPLCEASKHPACLVPFKGAICLEFMFDYPLA